MSKFTHTNTAFLNVLARLLALGWNSKNLLLGNVKMGLHWVPDRAVGMLLNPQLLLIAGGPRRLGRGAEGGRATCHTDVSGLITQMYRGNARECLATL